VFVSVLGDEQARRNALLGLERATGYLRRELAQRLQMRLTPALRFVLDTSWERGARLDALLDQLQSTASPDADMDSAPGEGEANQ